MILLLGHLVLAAGNVSRPAFVATFLSRFAPLTPVNGRIAQLRRSLLVVLME
jgi:hypothetical protein